MKYALRFGMGLLALALLPVAINEHLRFTYEATLAHWLSKIVRPDRVFIGDSMTASGKDFGHFGTINLATSGLTTCQIAGLLKAAQAYNPRHIFVMAGTNDVLGGAVDPKKLTACWRTMLADQRVAVTLLPHVRIPALNPQIDAINRLVFSMAHKAGHPVIAIPGLDNTDGTIQPRYTTDGTHLTPAARAIWRAQLDGLHFEDRG